MPYVTEMLGDKEEVEIQCINKVVVATKGEMRSYWATPTTMKLDDVIRVNASSSTVMRMFKESEFKITGDTFYNLYFKYSAYPEECINRLMINIFGSEQLNKEIERYARAPVYVYSDVEFGSDVAEVMERTGTICFHISVFDELISRCQASNPAQYIDIGPDNTTWVKYGIANQSQLSTFVRYFGCAGLYLNYRDEEYENCLELSAYPKLQLMIGKHYMNDYAKRLPFYKDNMLMLEERLIEAYKLLLQ